MGTKIRIALAGLVIFSLIGIAISSPSSKTAVEGSQTESPTTEVTLIPTDTPTPTIEQAQGDPDVLYDQGEESMQEAIDSRYYHPHQQICANATALCNDGTCSYSAQHRGTCSHHGGVATWNQ